jgi:tRNA 2-selenouridine synthase
LAQQWFKIPNNEKVWIENESRLIGKCVIPSAIFEMMKNAKVLELEVDLKHRINNIIEEYGSYEKNILIEKTLEIEKKLGNQNMRNSIAALLENDFNNWASILLDYYDKSYQNSKLKRDESTIFTFNYSNFQSIETLLQFARNID